MSLIGYDGLEAQRLWPDTFGMTETPPWAMPWISPGPIARQALAVLPYPLRACETGCYFDVDLCYEQWAEVRRLKAVEKAIRDLGDRLEWRLERVWGLDSESTSEEYEAYEKSAKVVGGCYINPRCLDDYVTQAYALMESIGMDEDNPDWKLDRDPETTAVWQAALNWAEAGVVVLQQSLPWPFTGVMPWKVNDNRPAHRALFAYASILDAKSRRKAKPWFTAMLYMNPDDNMGVRDFI